MDEYVLDETQWPSGMSVPLRGTLRTALSRLPERPEVLGLAAGGSFAFGHMDEFSDLDLAVVVTASAWPEVLRSRLTYARLLGPVLLAFGADHVGQPDLLICLYGPPPVHVDLTF